MYETPYDFIQTMTRKHQPAHGCGAYTFKDGPGLMALAREYKPARVLECGTALGYTACCLAAATPQTRVDTIEFDPDHVKLARDHIVEAGLGARVTVHEGDFTKIVPALEGQYGLVFFDGFAPDRKFLNVLRGKLREGGVLACANLGLVHDRARDADFSDAKRWRAIGEIEGGGTRAFVKVGAD